MAPDAQPSPRHQGESALDDLLSSWSDSDSLVFSCEGDEEHVARPLPPLAAPMMRGPLDGEWVLHTPRGSIASWLHSLTISGDVIVDGSGDTSFLRQTAQGPMLEGGLLKLDKGTLVRHGKTGAVQAPT